MVILITLRPGDAKPKGEMSLSKIAHLRVRLVEEAKRAAAPAAVPYRMKMGSRAQVCARNRVLGAAASKKVYHDVPPDEKSPAPKCGAQSTMRRSVQKGLLHKAPPALKSQL